MHKAGVTCTAVKSIFTVELISVSEIARTEISEIIHVIIKETQCVAEVKLVHA